MSAFIAAASEVWDDDFVFQQDSVQAGGRGLSSPPQSPRQRKAQGRVSVGTAAQEQAASGSTFTTMLKDSDVDTLAMFDEIHDLNGALHCVLYH